MRNFILMIGSVLLLTSCAKYSDPSTPFEISRKTTFEEIRNRKILEGLTELKRVNSDVCYGNEGSVINFREGETLAESINEICFYGNKEESKIRMVRASLSYDKRDKFMTHIQKNGYKVPQSKRSKKEAKDLIYTENRDSHASKWVAWIIPFDTVSIIHIIYKDNSEEQ